RMDVTAACEIEPTDRRPAGSGSAEIIAAARAAWSRLRRGASFDDWVVVARALAIGREQCMALAKTNKPVGTTYNRAMGAWLTQHGLDGINGQERYRALWMLDHLPAIEQWRADLGETERRRFNHPNCVWAKWRARSGAEAKRDEPPVRRHALARTKHGAGKFGFTVRWPQEFLKRAADAIAETRSSDCIVMARAALTAAIRGERDLLELLGNEPTES